MITKVLEHRLVKGAQVIEGYDEAIEGTSDCGRLIYHYDKMVSLLIRREEISTTEAMEWLDFNVIGGKAGEGFIVLYTINEDIP